MQMDVWIYLLRHTVSFHRRTDRQTGDDRALPTHGTPPPSLSRPTHSRYARMSDSQPVKHMETLPTQASSLRNGLGFLTLRPSSAGSNSLVVELFEATLPLRLPLFSLETTLPSPACRFSAFTPFFPSFFSSFVPFPCCSYRNGTLGM